jgi:hypothetical protein
MKYVIGLCGTHGTGKTTILKGLRDVGFEIIEISLAREAQKSLGWDSLSRARESIENMWNLQNAIVEAMFDRDSSIERSKQFTIVERTPADVWAYTEMWLNQHNINWMTNGATLEYKQLLRELSTKYAHFIQVPAIDEIPFVPEPNRADLPSREFVARAIEEFIDSGNLPSTMISGISKEDRVEQAQGIARVLSQLKE